MRAKRARAAGAPVRWSWACRVLPGLEDYEIDQSSATAPAPGDLALVQVEQTGLHERLMTRDNKRLRIYPGDFVAGVFGNRYATDAYEAEVQGTGNLSLVTGGGMIGTVVSRH